MLSWHLSLWIIIIYPLPLTYKLKNKGDVLLIFMFTTILLLKSSHWLTLTYWMNQFTNKYIPVSMNQRKNMSPDKNQEWKTGFKIGGDHFTSIRMTIKKRKKSMEKVEKLEPLHRNKFGWCRFYLIKQKFPYKIWELFCSSMPFPLLNNFTLH